MAYDIPINIGPSGLLPTPPATLNAQFVANVTAEEPGYTVLPGMADVVNGLFANASTQGTGIIGNVNVVMQISSGVYTNGSFNLICTGT